MAKAEQTNGMGTFMGRGAGVNEYGQIGLIAYTPKVHVKTADYTVLASESGGIFTTTGATGAVNFTLPAISDGPYVYYFLNGVGQNMVITAETADTIVTFNDAAADSLTFSTAGNLIGAAVMVVCDGTTLFAINLSVNTLTVGT